MFLWQGEGYSFHPTLKPKALEVPQLQLPPGQECLFIEAKPKRANEPRLQDAVKTPESVASALAPDISQCERVPAPEWSDRPPSIICWNCGECAHTARECLEDNDDL